RVVARDRLRLREREAEMGVGDAVLEAAELVEGAGYEEEDARLGREDLGGLEEPVNGAPRAALQEVNDRDANGRGEAVVARAACAEELAVPLLGFVQALEATARLAEVEKPPRVGIFSALASGLESVAEDRVVAEVGEAGGRVILVDDGTARGRAEVDLVWHAVAGDERLVAD